MANKVNIIEVATKAGSVFTVNGVLAAPDDVVERIVFEKHGYNKGRQGEFASYVIFYEGSNHRSIVPENQITRIEVEMVEEGNDPVGIIPELPE